MNEFFSHCQIGLNQVGVFFCGYVINITIQSSVLIVVLYLIDWAIRKKVRAVFRYFLWMLALVKLVLPPSFALPTGIGSWLGFMRGSDAVSPENWHGFVFLFWMFGVVLFSVLLIQRLFFIRSLVAQSVKPEEKLNSLLYLCTKEMEIETNVRLRLSPNRIGPSICGLFKPIILIPSYLSEQLDEKTMRIILIHELSHLKRHDLWMGTLQTVLQVLYFYHPLVWLANGTIRKIREQATDESVLVVLDRERDRYSHILIDIAEMAFSKPALSLRLLGVVESKNSLNERIAHIANRPAPQTDRLGLWGLAIILLAGVVFLPMESSQKHIENSWSNSSQTDSWQPEGNTEWPTTTK